MVERFNGRIEDVLHSHHFQSGEELEATLRRYVWLYNQQLPQSALGSKTPLQVMKDWHKLKRGLLRKQSYYRTGCDTYPISGPVRVDCIWRLLSTATPSVLSTGPLLSILRGNDQQSYEAGHGDRGAEHGGGLATDGRVLLSPHGSWLAILVHMTF
jgi:hypothetical protein